MPVHNKRTKRLINIGTSHLESPLPKTAPKRREQLREVGDVLTKLHDTETFKKLFMGD